MVERSAEPLRQSPPARPQQPQRPNEPSRLPQPTRVTARTLNSVELAFLERLSLNAWTSPPVFDHRLLDCVVDAGYVAKQPAALDAVHYKVTDNGRAAVLPSPVRAGILLQLTQLLKPFVFEAFLNNR